MTQTASSQVLEFLKTKDIGFEFSAKDMEGYLPDASVGGISGYVFKLRELGAIELVNRVRVNGKLRDIYRTKDLSLAHAKTHFTPGDQSARSGSPQPTNRQKLVDLVISIASEIERLKVSLADYSTDELVKELGRRAKAHDA